ncbi:MAG: hypothetical protein CMH75_00800 [Nitrospina sp.]|nr:hypothetical protein [Nitrospina sp.]|tara:strand:+ start:4656 stop:5411 length:756 start_codon:yes stop_codon:yes gene_type:complete
MQSFTALVRPPGISFPKAISNHPLKSEISFSKAKDQHRNYVEALKKAGAKILAMPPENSLPDSTFVEDAVFIFGDKAFLCSSKEETRRNEVESIEKTLKHYYKTVPLDFYLDGGDILDTPDTIFIGLSTRTDPKAIESLAKQIQKRVVSVPVLKGLHLKSAVSYLDKNILLLNPNRVDSSAFKNFQWIEVEENNSYAANCLVIGNQILIPSGFSSVRKKISKHGFKTIELNMSEFEKADGGITCLSVFLNE